MLDQIKTDLTHAQLQKDETRVSTLRLLISELQNAKIAKGEELADLDEVLVVQREVKKRKEAAEGFRSGGAEDRAKKEEAEMQILEEYLPTQLSDEQLEAIVDEAIAASGATNISDMGRVIGGVMAKVTGQADGGRVSGLVKMRLVK